jgi:hypothetical protein
MLFMKNFSEFFQEELFIRKDEEQWQGKKPDDPALVPFSDSGKGAANKCIDEHPCQDK